MSSPRVVIPPPRAPLPERPRYYWTVPCEDGEHDIFVHDVLNRYNGIRCSFPAICAREVWPATPMHPAKEGRCADCERGREAMSPRPVYWGHPWALMRALAFWAMRHNHNNRDGERDEQP